MQISESDNLTPVQDHKRKKVAEKKYQRKEVENYLPIAPMVAAAKGPEPGISSTWVQEEINTLASFFCLFLLGIQIQRLFC